MRILAIVLACSLCAAADEGAEFRLKPYALGDVFMDQRSFKSELAIKVTNDQGTREFARATEQSMRRRNTVSAVKGGRVRALEVRYEAFFKGDPESGEAEKKSSPILGKDYRVELGERLVLTGKDGAELERLEKQELEDAEAVRPRAPRLLEKVPERALKIGESFEVPAAEARRLLSIVYEDFRFDKRSLVVKERSEGAWVFAFEAAGAVERPGGYRFRLAASGTVRVAKGRLARVELSGTAEVEEKRMGRTTEGKSRFTVLETAAPAKSS